jgi:hypothetical protein
LTTEVAYIDAVKNKAMMLFTSKQPASNLKAFIAGKGLRDEMNPANIHTAGPTRHVPIMETPSQVGHVPSVHLGVQNRHIASERMRPTPSHAREIAKRRIT